MEEIFNSKHPLYSIFSEMHQRCYNINYKRYYDWGGRGIKVCEEWKNNFPVFYIWAMENGYAKGLSIDRVDNDIGYSPTNCRWVAKTVQSRNTRNIYKHNTSGFRGVCFNKRDNKWQTTIMVNGKTKFLGLFPTALEAGKAYERYVRLNNLEHNFTTALTEEEISELELNKL